MLITFLIAIAVLMSTSFYLLISNQLISIFIGLSLFSLTITTVLFFTGILANFGGIAPSFLDNDKSTTDMADPLPQALVLTAIVISFGVMAFVITMFHKINQMK